MSKSRTNRRGLTLMELVVVLMILVALAAIVVPLMTGVTSDAQVTTTKASMTALRNAVLQYYQDMKGIQLGRVVPGTSTVDSTGMPQTLKDLQIAPLDPLGNPMAHNPATQRGWRGPYLTQATGVFLSTSATASPRLDATFANYGSPGDVAFLDAWGNPIVLQWPSVGQGTIWNPTQDDLTSRVQCVRLVSAGKSPPGSLAVLNTVRFANLNSGGAIACMPTQPTPAQQKLADQRGGDLLLFILTQDLYSERYP